MKLPVYLFTGFLEGGKTTIIQESLNDQNFNSGEKTLILLCEEGIEELAKTVIPIAEYEGFYAHANSVKVRLDKK